MSMRAHPAAIAARLGGPVDIVVKANDFVADIRSAQQSHIADLHTQIKAPVVQIPVIANKPGLATTRVIAAMLSDQQ
jgi:hypothetical protein